jgi:hypothetical protein
MKKHIYITFLLLISNFVFSQVTDLFSSQVSDFTTTSKNQYTVVESQQTSSFTTQVGAPQLPIFNRNYALPPGSIVSNVTVTNSGKTLVGNTIYLYPSQPPCPLNGEPCPDFVNPDPVIYNSKIPYPSQTGTLIADVSNFGYRMVSVSICPFEYDRKLYLYNQYIS